MGVPEHFRLTPWRGQYAHLPLVFAPFLLSASLAMVGAFLDSHGQAAAGTILTAVGGLVFTAGILAMPRLWRKWRTRGGLLLTVDHDHVILRDHEGTFASEMRLVPGGVRRGVFSYTMTMRFGGGTYLAPLVAISFPDRTLTVGGIGVAPDPGSLPTESPPGFSLPAGDWDRLVKMLGVGANRLADSPS